jgi:hypothetical protein
MPLDPPPPRALGPRRRRQEGAQLLAIADTHASRTPPEAIDRGAGTRFRPDAGALLRWLDGDA